MIAHRGTSADIPAVVGGACARSVKEARTPGRELGCCYNLAKVLAASESGGMVDTLDLGSSAFGRAGSNPASRTSPPRVGPVKRNWRV